MRDNIKNIEYFNCFINEDLERVNKFCTKLENGEVKAERIFSIKSKVHDLKLGILIARYSRGDEISLLERDYLRLLDYWEDVWKPEYYNKNLKLISLAVLFKADKVRTMKIRNMLENSNVKDWLFYFLLNSLDGELIDNSQNMFFPDAFYTLQKVVFEENKVELLKKYLSKEWYNEDCGCYEAHKSS